MPRALASALTQDSADLEVIVVDDASTDQTREIVLRTNDERLRYIRLAAKSNGNVARNIGIASARSSLVAFLDSDDEFLPGRALRLVNFFRNNETIGSVLDSFQIVNGQDIEIAKQPSARMTGNALVHLLVCHALPLTCSAIAARREALRAVGGFDPNLVRQQDRDLLLKLARSHVVALGTAEDVVKHQGSDSISRLSTDYVHGLDELVARHPVFREPGYRDLLAYLAVRVVVKALLKGEVPVAWREGQALLRSASLPRSLFGALARYRKGRLIRRHAEAAAALIGGP